MTRADDPAHPALLAAARSFGRSSALAASLAARAVLPESSGGACSARAAARASVKAFRAAATPDDVVAAAVTMFRAAARSAAAVRERPLAEELAVRVDDGDLVGSGRPVDARVYFELRHCIPPL